MKGKLQPARAGAVVRVYWKYLMQHPVLFATSVFGVVSVQLITLTTPIYMRQFFNVLANVTPSVAAGHTLYSVLIVIAGLWLFNQVMMRIYNIALLHLEANVMAQLMEDSFAYLLGHSHNFFASNFSGALTHKVSKFARAFEALLDGAMFTFLPAVIFISGAIIVLAVHNAILGLLFGVLVVMLVAFQFIASRRLRPLRIARAEAETRNTATLADAISNHSAIQLFASRRYEESLTAGVVGAWRTASLRAWMADSYVWLGVGMFNFVIQVSLLFGAVYYWQLGLLSLGDFVLIQMYLLSTFDRVTGLNREMRRVFDNFADAGEMVAIIQAPYDVKDKPHAIELKIARADIAFKSVDFAFNPTNPILSDLNLSIRAGEKVALVGPSGAGKSTITKILLRLYDVSKGSVLIDGHNIADVTQESLRASISYVPQEPVLFHRTLKENISYGRRDASDAELFEAAKKAHCDEFISHLPLKYDTLVGERGIKLSGGERQRVAIARAILKNAPILILDEATSSLDSESESLIQDALSVLMRGKTVIVIAHRLSTIMKMDRIVVVEGGNVVAQGTHDELLAQGGLYRKLWDIQAGGFIPEEEEADPLN